MDQSYRPYERSEPIFDRAIEKLKADGNKELDGQTIHDYYLHYWTQAPFSELQPRIAIKLFFHTPDLGVETVWSALDGAHKAATESDHGHMNKEKLVWEVWYCDEDSLMSALRSELAACYSKGKGHPYDT